MACALFVPETLPPPKDTPTVDILANCCHTPAHLLTCQRAVTMSLPQITIYDTLAGERRPFQPIEPGKVRMYVCGVTTYDYSHIGHGRTFVSFDIITRYLRHRGYELTYVRNHTDIDDKIIQRANEINDDPIALSARFITAFDEDMERLGCTSVDVAPKVTEHIDQIIEITQKLIDRDRKSTRLNSSHVAISYAVFCLK